MNIWRDRLRGFLDVAHVRLAIFIEWSRDADDHSVHIGDSGVIRRCFEPSSTSATHFFGSDADDVRAAGIQKFDFAGVDVEPSDSELLFRKQKHKRQAYVAKSDPPDLGGAR